MEGHVSGRLEGSSIAAWRRALSCVTLRYLLIVVRDVYEVLHTACSVPSTSHRA